jgi:hypothetical protein
LVKLTFREHNTPVSLIVDKVTGMPGTTVAGSWKNDAAIPYTTFLQMYLILWHAYNGNAISEVWRLPRVGIKDEELPRHSPTF